MPTLFVGMVVVVVRGVPEARERRRWLQADARMGRFIEILGCR